jgi:tRNA1(Val) A37 N6-methylase TrmN6
MSGLHATPPEIARALALHAPRSVARILDPAVGDGSLLLPLLERVGHPLCEVTGVDVDPVALRRARARLEGHVTSRQNLFRADFLKWARQIPRGGRFDCVVANPPFAARRGDWVTVPLTPPWVESETNSELCPVEVAFVTACVDTLEPGGRLLSIVPSSIVASSRCEWLRRSLFSQGSIRLVHELPRYTFRGIESRFYFLVFDKARKAREFFLCNHDLHHPERLVMRQSKLDDQLRLDFSFHDSSANYLRKLREQHLGWQPLGEIASLHRGSEKDPSRWSLVAHTSHYRSGFWRSRGREASEQVSPQTPTIRRGDLLIKRVGRDCSQSLGRPIGMTDRSCSDCVLIVRPQVPSESTRLLFALRCLLSAGWARALVERGTGAAYLSRDSLVALRVPFALPQIYPREFDQYRRAARSRDFSTMRSVEIRVCKQLKW